jgi:hypothetical protein
VVFLKKTLNNRIITKIIIVTLILALCVSIVCACGGAADYDGGYDNQNGSSVSPGTVPDDLKDLKLIYEARITVETEDYNKYIEELQLKINQYGGYISSSRENTTETLKRGVLTIRVPSENFNEMKAATANNGVVVSSSHEVKDVTESYMDIEGRLTTLKAERDALNAMLEKAYDVSTMLQIRKEINNLNIEIESYQRQLNKYDNQIAYSTITLTVEQEIESEGSSGLVIFLILLFILPETLLCIGIIVFIIVFNKRKKSKKLKGE